MTINWNHHPDRSCGVIRHTNDNRQWEGYYTSYNDKWQIATYDNWTDKRGWSRIEYLQNLEGTREQIIEKLTLFIPKE